MVNGKIIFGTLFILTALVAFFDTLGEIRTGIDYVPVMPIVIISVLGTCGIIFVRSGISRKRKTS